MLLYWLERMCSLAAAMMREIAERQGRGPFTVSVDVNMARRQSETNRKLAADLRRLEERLKAIE